MAQGKSEPGREPPSSKSPLQLNERQRLSWLRLTRGENVGPATFRGLVNQFSGTEAALAALLPLSGRGGRASIRVFRRGRGPGGTFSRRSAGARLVAMGEAGYAPSLTHVDAPPPVLYAKGRLELAEGPIIAMVGARNGSAIGQKFTRHRLSAGERRSPERHRRMITASDCTN